MAFQIKNTFACAENWDKMNPTEKGKFCEVCTKEVIDFTVLSKNEIVAVFKKNNYQALCARAYPSQLSTIYLEDSLENVSWNLPFWQKFLLVFLVCFGPEFLNVNLVFAQDSTSVQTDESMQDSLIVNKDFENDSVILDSTQLSIVNQIEKTKSKKKEDDFYVIECTVSMGNMMPFEIDYSIPLEQVLTGGFVDFKRKKNENENLEYIFDFTSLFPLKLPEKKPIPEKLLFVPMSSFLKPKQNNQKAT